MARKLTYEEVKNYIEVESNSGCVLLSKEYINNRAILEIECSCGEKYYKNFFKFKSENGFKCTTCTGYNKWNIEKVKHFIEVESGSGYTLLSTSYKNNKEKLLVTCNKGHTYEVIFDSFKGTRNKKGARCAECAGYKKHTTEAVYEEFKNLGVVLEEGQEYKNSKSLLNAITKEGYKIVISLEKLRAAKKGKYLIFSIKNPYTIWNIKNVWLPKYAPDYELLEAEWNGSTYEMSWNLKNSKFRPFSMSWNHFSKRRTHPEIAAQEARISSKTRRFKEATRDINEILTTSNSKWKLARNQEKIFVNSITHLYFVDDEGYISKSNVSSIRSGDKIKRFHISYPHTSLYNFRRWLGLNSIYKLKDESTYNGYGEKTTLICNIHGDFEASPHSIIDANGVCSKCSITRKITHAEFLVKLNDLTGEEYSILDEYNGSKNKIRFKHSKCDKIFKMSPGSFTSGSRCLFCSSTRGEARILDFLDKIGMASTVQKTFSDCKKFRSLSFDIFIENKLLIEYDGQQHFYGIDFFGGESAFNLTKERDKIKNQYCIDNRIPLIRIPYWEFDNIEIILESVLSHYSLIESDLNNKKISRMFSKWLVDDSWNQDRYISLSPKNEETNKSHSQKLIA